jgi:hypothetical protein
MTAQKTRPDHVITIELKQLTADVLGAVPSIPSRLHVGETVGYSSAVGSFRIEFPGGSPFGEGAGPLTIKEDSGILMLTKNGKFDCRCFMTLSDGREIGWSEQFPASGGVHDVGR